MEITRNNYFDELENITKDLNKSCLVGFDAEFTAILSGDLYKHRLFDTNEERYNRLKNEMSKMIMTQVGLTMFQYDRDLDSYIATGYTFHLCPQVIADLDQSFIFQASTLKFLCKHNFDFNKFLYEGLPFLSKAEEEKVLQDLKDRTMVQKLIQSLEIAEEKLLQEYCSQVSKWLSLSEDGTVYLDVESPILRYLVHNEIRMRFPNVLTTDSLGNSKKILVYRDKYVEGANSAPMAILEDNLMNHLRGFSQIISLLAASQKPIVGHNIFLDTVFLHNQFIGPLPNKYSVFKKNIHNMFPNFYDTKYISNQMSKKLTFNEVWKSNSLQELLVPTGKNQASIHLNVPNILTRSVRSSLVYFVKTIQCLQSYNHIIKKYEYPLGQYYLFTSMEQPSTIYPFGYIKGKGMIRSIIPPSNDIGVNITTVVHETTSIPPKNDKCVLTSGLNVYLLSDVGHSLDSLERHSQEMECSRLYEFFAEGKCIKLQNGVNHIRVSRPFNVKQSYHEAGWDSYCSGYCLIRLGHWVACENSGKYKPVGPTETLAALMPFANKVNIIRGAIPYMNLVGDDPPSHRPALLHIKALAERTINISQMASILASCGSIDIKPNGRSTALIATNATITVDRIMKRFKNSKEYKVSPYNVYKHSMAARMAIWSGALLTGSLVLYMLHKKVKVLIM